jgi:plasmid stabilization system protein ParE
VAARRRVVWAPRAQAALDEAVEFVTQDSVPGAFRVLEQALAAAESLATLAERGRVVPELNEPNTREIFVFRYRLLYEVEPEDVRIVAFLHGARDFERWQRETER